MADYSGESFDTCRVEAIAFGTKYNPSPFFVEGVDGPYPHEALSPVPFEEGVDGPYPHEGISGFLFGEATPPEGTAPNIAGAIATSSTTVDVVFDSEMLQDTVLLNASSYTIDGLTVRGVSVKTSSPAGTTITLRTTEQTGSRRYLLVASAAIRDLGLNFISTRSAYFSGISGETSLLLGALIKPLPSADRDLGIADPEPGGRDLLKRYLRGPETLHNETRARIRSLSEQLDPALCREDLLQYLKDIVGLTRELDYITERLSTSQLRRLIAVAAALWKQRYTRQGIINSVRTLTGRIPIVTDWFGFRFLIGETAIEENQLVSGGDSWIIGGATTEYDEFWTNVRVMDDGTLDEQLLLDIIMLMRPLSERVDVTLLDFLDRFALDKGQWTQITGSWTLNEVDERMEIPASGGEQEAVIPIVPVASLSSYAVITKFNLAGASARAILRWYVQDANTYYYVRIQGSPVHVQLRRLVGFTDTLLASVNPTLVSIVEGANYKLRVQTINESGQNRIRVYIDNELITEYVDATGSRPLYGPFRLAADTQAVWFDNVEMFRIPGRYATIDVGTPSEPMGVVDMTDNFVQ